MFVVNAFETKGQSRNHRILKVANVRRKCTYNIEDCFGIRVSAVVTCGDKKEGYFNRILEYSTDSTWEDVYLDLAEESDFSTNKTDVVINLKVQPLSSLTFMKACML